MPCLSTSNIFIDLIYYVLLSAYSQEYGELMAHTMEKLKVTISLIDDFRSKMYQEEQLSRSMKA